MPSEPIIRSHRPNRDGARLLWAAVQGELQLSVDRGQYNTWLKETEGLDLAEDLLVVGTPNEFVLRWLEGHLSEAIRRVVVSLAGHQLDIEFRVVGSPMVEPHAVEAVLTHEAPPVSPPASPTTTRPRFDARYTLDSFIVGPSNRLAFTAARAVAERPATIYNPLFLYGGVGLGKTHLLHAVGRVALQQGLTVIYASSEQFMNEFINSIRERSAEEFRQKWRSADLLLIDDIQFIAGKEQTQEEFFHTFNDVYTRHRQIVLTSDRSPKHLPGVEDRLRSRFEWGLIADIQPPDIETRMAIIRAKADHQGVALPDPVVALIAGRALDNIRELEGLVNRVIAFHQLTQQPVGVELATQALAGLTPARRNLPQPHTILDAVQRLFRIQPEDLTSPRRDQKLAYARHLAMYLLYEDCRRPLSEIGRLLGGRDHTTILYGHTKVARLVTTNPTIRQDLAELRDLINASP